MILRAEAPAKINRELRVGARRADGFHPILSRLTTIDLADAIEVSSADGLSLTVEGASLAADDSNLVAKAARLLADRLAIAPGARIRLEKKVPVGAGLGGGSADAAVTLSLLAALWDARLSAGEMTDLAARLGSDVPFFLVGGEADIAGRGEIVTPREDARAEELLLLVPPFSLSTADVYAVYDRVAGSSDWGLASRLEIETSGRFFGPNDLASAMLETDSEMTTLLRTVAQTVRDFAMTGSGSALALRGISSSAAQGLARAHPQCRLLACRTIGREEYRRRIHPSGGPSWR